MLFKKQEETLAARLCRDIYILGEFLSKLKKTGKNLKEDLTKKGREKEGKEDKRKEANKIHKNREEFLEREFSFDPIKKNA